MVRTEQTITLAMASALVLAASSLAVAQPRAVVEEPIVDFGLVTRGDDVEHRFDLDNEGDAELEILEVDPTCGCTVVDYSEKVPPGERGTLDVTMQSKGLRGPVAKTVRVFTNDPRNPQIDLVLKANVRAYVEAEPGYARFLAVLGQGAEPITQVLYSEIGGEFAVTEVASPYEFIDVSYHEATDDERLSGRSGRQWVLEVGLQPDAPVGGFADFVTVQVTHPQLKRFRLPVSGFVQPVVAVLPRVIDFGRKDLSQPQSTFLEVKNLGEPAITLGVVETTVDGLDPELEVVEEGRLYRLRLTLDPAMPKGEFRGTLTIPTSSRLQPEVEVDVRGTIL